MFGYIILLPLRHSHWPQIATYNSFSTELVFIIARFFEETEGHTKISLIDFRLSVLQKIKLVK